MDPEALTPINVDVMNAVSIGLNAAPRLAKLRASLIALAPGIDLSRVERLEDFANALGHAHTLYVAAASPADALGDVYKEALGLREALVNDAASLARRGLLPQERARGAERDGRVQERGDRSVGARERVPRALGRGAVAHAGGDAGARPRRAAQPSHHGAARRAREGGDEVAEAGLLRAQAFTAFAHVTPSIYGGKKRSKKEREDEAGSETPMSETPAPGGAAADGDTDAGGDGGAVAPSEPATPLHNNPDLPGSNPFIS